MPVTCVTVRVLARCVAVLLAAAFLVPLTPSAPIAAASTRTGAEATAEAIMFELHQQARTSPGSFTARAGAAAAPFSGWSDLRDSARRWSQAQARGVCPGGSLLCHNTVANGGPGYTAEMCCRNAAAENVAVRTFRVGGSTPSTGELRTALHETMANYMASDAHRRNLLNPRFDHVGTSVVLVDLGARYWRLHTTTVFREYDGSPLDAAIISFVGAPSPAPTVARSTTDRRVPATCPDAPEARFPDVDHRTAVGAAAGCLGDLRITAGARDGTYRPASAVTRAQMASFLTRAVDQMGRPAPVTEGAAFADISGTHADAITRLHAAGIASGRTTSEYAPGASVTRAQMASFLARAAEYAAGRPLPAGTSVFRDVGASPHADSIDRLAAAGIAAGTGPGTFSPDRPVTRGQMALFLTRLITYHASR